jgi:phage baseplate assembly protein W
MPIGLTLPFARSTGSLGYLQATETELDAVKQNLTSLLVTNWGERVMNYYFGCNLIEFLFSSLRNSELKQRIADRILEQVAKWLPFVNVDSLNVIFPEDDDTGSVPPNGIMVMLKFSLASRPDLSDSLSQVIS